MKEHEREFVGARGCVWVCLSIKERYRVKERKKWVRQRETETEVGNSNDQQSLRFLKPESYGGGGK